MPQRKYYCDYCDRSFVDSKEQREMHFKSVSHQNNVRLWYQSRKETATIVKEQSAIPICDEFKKTGFCPMGNQYPYRHIAVTDVERNGGSVIPFGLMESTVRSIEDTVWLPVDPKSVHPSQTMETDPTDSMNAMNAMNTMNAMDPMDPMDAIDAYASKLLPLKVDLPPSLIPIHSSIFQSVPPCDWG